MRRLALFVCGLVVLALAIRPSDVAAGASSAGLDELTRRLSALGAQASVAEGGARADAEAALVEAAEARQQRLAALIAERPDLVLRHALSAKVRASLPRAAQRFLEQDATAEGDLEVLHEDGPNGSRYHYFLKRAGGRIALHFAAQPPSLQTGDRVRVSGVQVDKAMALASGSTSVASLALVASNTIGAQPTAVILVAFQDAAAPSWLTADNAYKTILSAEPTSVASFFREASYGRTWLTGDVYGPFTIPVSRNGCETGAISAYGDQAAKAVAGAAKMATYRRFVYLFPGNGCGWIGLGTVGGKPAQAWINGRFDAGLVAHEMGHGFGLQHSHALACVQASVGPDCASIEYGDPFDVMGYTDHASHFNAVQKELLGWLNYAGAPPVTTVKKSGVYTIDPYESAGTKPKALKIQSPTGEWFYVEYRQALGFDAGALDGNANVAKGVLVHLWRYQHPDHIYLLDMTPTMPDWRQPALGVGDTFTDPASGITISTLWANETAGVSVTIGDGGSVPCVRKSPSVSVSPAQQQGKGGTTLSYAVSITNNDTGCPASSFATEASAPSGWTVKFASAALQVTAGATGSLAMQVTSPATAAAGTYTISPKVFDSAAPSYAVTAKATYSVPSGGNTGTPPGGGTGGGPGDDFNRGDATGLGPGWMIVSGGYALQGNAAVATGASSLAVREGVDRQTESAQASFVRPTTASGTKFGVVLRYKNPKTYYVCYRQAGGSSQFKISKVVNGVEVLLKAVTAPQAPIAAPFTVTCSVSAGVISIGDGTAVKTFASDLSLASGSVGIFTDKAGLKVESFSASLP